MTFDPQMLAYTFYLRSEEEPGFLTSASAYLEERIPQMWAEEGTAPFSAREKDGPRQRVAGHKRRGLKITEAQYAALVVVEVIGRDIRLGYAMDIVAEERQIIGRTSTAARTRRTSPTTSSTSSSTCSCPSATRPPTPSEPSRRTP